MYSKQVIDQEAFKCERTRCKHVLSFATLRKYRDPSDPSRSLIRRSTCTSANVIYCITCTLCKKLYIGETGRRLGDRFRERLRDVEKDDKNASQPGTYGSLRPLPTAKTHESRKTFGQKFSFQIGTLNPHGINKRFSFNYSILLFSRYQAPTNSVAPSFCI